MMRILQAQVCDCISVYSGLPHQKTKQETSDASTNQLNQAVWNRKVLKFGSEIHFSAHICLLIRLGDSPLLARSRKSHITVSLMGFAPVLRIRSRRDSEGFGWSRSRIPNNTRSRSRCQSLFFLSDSDSGNPIGSLLHHIPKLGIPIEMAQFPFKFLLKQIFVAVHHDFHCLLIATKLLTAKVHSLYVTGWEWEILERSESGVGNFEKVRVGFGRFTSDSANLVWAAHLEYTSLVLKNVRITGISIRTI